MKKIAIFALTAILTVQVAAPARAENTINQPATETAEAEAPGAEVTDNKDIVIYSNEFPTNTPTGNSTVMVGTTVGIKKTGEDTVRIKVIHCARTAIAETSICEAQIIENKAAFNWEDPNYMSYGDGEITFYDDYITITMETIQGGRFSFHLDNEILKEDYDVTFAEDFISQLGGAAPDYSTEPGPMDQSMAVG